MLLYDVLQRALHGQPTAHLNNLDLASCSLDVLAWAGQLDSTAKQYHASLKPIYILACSLNRRVRESSSYPATDHVHFREIHGTSPIHDATHKVSQMLYVALRPEHGRKKTASSYRPNMAETATSLDEVGLGVYLYWAMEFDAEGTSLKNEEIFRPSSFASSLSSVLPSLQGQFAGGNQPCGWTTTKSFDDPVLTEASTTDLFG